MNCRQARRLAWEAGAGEVSEQRRAALRRHRESCAACAAAESETARLAATLDEWAVECEPSAGFEAQLRARIAAAEAAGGWRAAWRQWRTWAGARGATMLAAAALAVVVLVGGGVWMAAHRQTAGTQMEARTGAAAVHDLEVLDRDSEMLEHFDLLGEPPAAAAQPAAQPVAN